MIIKQVYNLTRGESSRRSFIIEEKSSSLHGPRLLTDPEIYLFKPHIFLHDSPTRNPHLFENAQSRRSPFESGKAKAVSKLSGFVGTGPWRR